MRHHVVIIGSGFGGLWACRRLKDADVDVTVVDRTTHHLFQPLLYQVATGILSEGEIAPPFRLQPPRLQGRRKGSTLAGLGLTPSQSTLHFRVCP